MDSRDPCVTDSMETVPALDIWPLGIAGDPGIVHNVEDGELNVPIAIRSNLPYNVTATVVTRSLPNGSFRFESYDSVGSCEPRVILDQIIIKHDARYRMTYLWFVLKCDLATPIVPSAEPAFELQCVSVNACIVNNMSTGGEPMIARELMHIPVFLNPIRQRDKWYIVPGVRSSTDPMGDKSRALSPQGLALRDRLRAALRPAGAG